MGSRRTSQKRSGGVTIHRLRRSLFGPGCAITIEKSLKDLLHTATAAAAHDTQLVEIQYLRLNLLASDAAELTLDVVEIYLIGLLNEVMS
jgi:hypothetical protein